MKHYTYNDLIDIIAALRGEKGCSWDKAQTHESLVPHLIEESYELVEAINNKDTSNMKEELGDVLLQVLMHAQIAAEEKKFSIEDVVDGIARKLVYRHPHVFGEGNHLKTTKEVEVSWEQLKKAEKGHQTQTENLDSIPKALPALIRAYKIQKKAGAVGFTWDCYEPIIDKIIEELEEVKAEIKNNNQERLNEEIGDLLFAITNLSYFFEINPEFALTKATEKFINRFRYIENTAFARGQDLSEMTLDEMDQLWQMCKQLESDI